METFGEWLKKQLEARRMTQKELAIRSGVTPAQISRVISGERGVGEQSIIAIAHALQLPPETVFRAAGLLPPASADKERLARLMHLASMLDDDDLEDLETLAEAKAARNKDRPPTQDPAKAKQQYASRKKAARAG